MRLLFEILRRLLVATTGRGYDRSPRINNVHHKLAFRLHKMLPAMGIRGVQRVAVDSSRHLYVRADDGGVGHQWLMYRQYEPFETSLVLQHLQTGMTVFNIGANIGYYTLIASGHVGASGQVIAFEPAASNLELLDRVVMENNLRNVRVMPVAVGASDGVATLALSSTNSGDHQVFAEGRGDRATSEVRLRSVDSIIAEGFSVPDAIIMDVQGSELDVLRGMEVMLANPILKIIFTEYWQGGLNARQADGAKEFIETLSSTGFTFQIIDEKVRSLRSVAADELLRPRPLQEELNLLCIR